MTTVLPQIDSFAKSRSESDSEIYEDNQQSTSPVSTDSDRVKPYVPDLSIKFEHQEHDSVITYGGDDVVDNYENVSFRNLLTDQQPEWPVYSLSPEMDTSSHQFYPVPPTYQSVECGQVVPNYNFDLEPTLTAEVPQYYPEVYPTDQPHRVSVIVGNSEHGDVQYGQQEFQMPYYSSQVFESPPITYKRKEKRKEKKKSPKSVIYFEKSELTPDHKNGIHLWQFLLSLLRQPKFEKHIKWVDQARGIFKIEDSQEVARLWGLRKNRPNMNYDKLSRSIRQYYKKNIIKKPKETSRLVYQFCDKIISDNKFAVKSIMCE